jgi:hypothetical protein
MVCKYLVRFASCLVSMCIFAREPVTFYRLSFFSYCRDENDISVESLELHKEEHVLCLFWHHQ